MTSRRYLKDRIIRTYSKLEMKPRIYHFDDEIDGRADKSPDFPLACTN